jgi:hypothetical protein
MEKKINIILPIDHKVTKKELQAIWGLDEFPDFNNRATALDLIGLYTWRDNYELVDYYESVAPKYNRFPKDSDCLAIDIDTGKYV